MTDRQLTNGEPVPEDHSHTEIMPGTGMQLNYVVLTIEERAKGFVKPVRVSYVHKTCRSQTTMGLAIAETYARDPKFYSGTFCVSCRKHFALSEFNWSPDGEPMCVLLQDDWHAEQKKKASAEPAKFETALELAPKVAAKLHRDRAGRDTTLECASIRLIDAIAKLGEFEPITKVTYFEASPSKDAEAFKRWTELNDALALVKHVLNDRKASEKV